MVVMIDITMNDIDDVDIHHDIDDDVFNDILDIK